MRRELVSRAPSGRRASGTSTSKTWTTHTMVWTNCGDIPASEIPEFLAKNRSISCKNLGKIVHGYPRSCSDQDFSKIPKIRPYQDHQQETISWKGKQEKIMKIFHFRRPLRIASNKIFGDTFYKISRIEQNLLCKVQTLNSKLCSKKSINAPWQKKNKNRTSFGISQNKTVLPYLSFDGNGVVVNPGQRS